MEHVGHLAPKTGQGKPKSFSLKGFLNHRQIKTVYPLFGMLTLAFGLAGMTAARTLGSSPDVTLDKKRRSSDEMQEIHDPKAVAEKGKLYAETGPLYKLAKGSKFGAAITGAQKLPPVLPGDESSQVGVQGTQVNRGRRGGGI